MPSSATKPDQFATEVVVSTTAAAGTIGTAGIDFTFDAGQLLVINDKTTSVYMSLDSSSGSTGGHQIKPNESRSFAGIRCGKMSLASTSTSTGDFVRVGAWSYA